MHLTSTALNKILLPTIKANRPQYNITALNQEYFHIRNILARGTPPSQIIVPPEYLDRPPLIQ